jgi:hypothetical protein
VNAPGLTHLVTDEDSVPLIRSDVPIAVTTCGMRTSVFTFVTDPELNPVLVDERAVPDSVLGIQVIYSNYVAYDTVRGLIEIERAATTQGAAN